ncbi:MAG: non-homologous end-joining DNA ligase [Anaerobacillus sp.]|uniref:non-homologous end-joining DNA ligase n=1 Tax=Anaerobacillus sp. TaxID=1872506 RepID=UPI00391A24CC
MVKLLKPMLPSLVTEIPSGTDWVYEVKYDGFRAIVYLEEEKITIVSRNQNILNEQFPEIIEAFKMRVQDLPLPIILDGELCVLDSPIRANFEKIQKRGRLKSLEKIEQAKKVSPVTFLAFDLLMENGDYKTKMALIERKKQLKALLEQFGKQSFVDYVEHHEQPHRLWGDVLSEKGEGLIAKQKLSLWQEGRSKQWQKIKNMAIASFFVLAYDETNAFFHIGCIYQNEIKLIGKVGQGFTKEEKEALIAIIKKNRVKTEQGLTYVKPSICIEVEFLELSKNELRHPKFRRFRLDKKWEDCTWEAIPKTELR